MKRFIFFFVSLFFGLGLFYWVVKTIGFGTIIKAFDGFNASQGAVIVGISLLSLFIENWKWREVLNAQGVRVPFFGLLAIFCVGWAASYLAPMALVGSEISRGYFLNKKYGVSWPKGISSVVINRILSWTMNLIFIFGGLSFFLSSIGLLSKKMSVVLFVPLFVFTFAASAFYIYSFGRGKGPKSLLGFFSRRADKSAGPWREVFEVEQEILGFFKPKNPALWRTLAISFLKMAVVLLRTWILVFFLARAINFLPAVSLLGFSLLTAMIPIPANLGSHEAVQALAFGLLGLGEGQAVAFTMVIRASELLVAFIGALFVLKLGIDILKRTLFRTAERLRVNNE